MPDIPGRDSRPGIRNAYVHATALPVPIGSNAQHPPLIPHSLRTVDYHIQQNLHQLHSSSMHSQILGAVAANRYAPLSQLPLHAAGRFFDYVVDRDGFLRTAAALSHPQHPSANLHCPLGIVQNPTQCLGGHFAVVPAPQSLLSPAQHSGKCIIQLMSHLRTDHSNHRQPLHVQKLFARWLHCRPTRQHLATRWTHAFCRT